MYTVLKPAKLSWTGHVIRMPDERLPKKVISMENYKRESALKVARRNATKTPAKPLSGISTYQLGLGNRLHRSDQSGGEVSSTKEQLFMKKRKSKRRERKANTNGQPADSMTLTCSTCNARIGLVSHLRTHQHTRTYSRNDDGLSHK